MGKIRETRQRSRFAGLSPVGRRPLEGACTSIKRRKSSFAVICAARQSQDSRRAWPRKLSVPGAFLVSSRYAPGFEPIRIETGRRSADFAHPGRSLRLLPGRASWMSESSMTAMTSGSCRRRNRETTPTLHVCFALGTCRRIYLVDLREKADPGSFACITVNLFVPRLMRTVRSQSCPWRVRLSYTSFKVRHSLGDPGHVLPAPFCTGCVQPIAANQLQTLRRD